VAVSVTSLQQKDGVERECFDKWKVIITFSKRLSFNITTKSKI
jgi:hypothetical protein